jgi:Cft2 family RNA processing exonuclease
MNLVDLMLQRIQPQNSCANTGSSSDSKGEKKCREIMQKMYNLSFPKVRPAWLRNPHTGKRLELDCYNSALGLAVEYDGQQHQAYNPHFHSSKKQWQEQVFRDKVKDFLCDQHGVRLIRVPDSVKLHEIERFLHQQLGLLASREEK